MGRGLAVLAASLLLGATAANAALEGSPRSTIGVAPFAPVAAEPTDAAMPDVARLLASELARRTEARVVSPADMRLGGREDRVTEAAAADVRKWADLNGVDRVVVGSAVRAERGGLNVDVELRSGHSGAAEAEYRLEPSSDPDVPGAVSKLATLILADLADVEPEPALPAVGAPRAGVESKTGSSKASKADDDGGDDEGGVSLMPGVRNDDPISINSEELEVVPLDGGRRLVFSRNVRVVQGDIHLRADRLEAIYPQGESRPERLVAEGHVAVEQGERNAKCEQATYERKLQTIVCRGKAEVVQGCDRVRGREIEFDLEQERVRVRGAASVLIRPDDENGDCSGKGMLE